MFGTDGIRGKAEIFDDILLRNLAKALVYTNNKNIMIAKDTRVSGTDIEKRLSGFLVEYGARVNSLGIIPTPVLSFLTQKFEQDCGIMISASHNPPEYNGIKIFDKCGIKLTEKEEKELTKVINSNLVLPQKLGKYIELNLSDLYIKYLFKNFKFSNSRLKIAIDTANGATSILAEKIFSKISDVKVFCKNTTGEDINLNCGATCMENILSIMEHGDFDLGFSFDGDGDRALMVYDGKVIDGDGILFIIADYLKTMDKLKENKVVATIMTNMGGEKSLKNIGIKLLRTKVGDKFVAEKLDKNKLSLGGEQSGHIIVKEYLETGDGIFAAFLLTYIYLENKFSALKKYTLYPQKIVSIKLSKAKMEDIKKHLPLKALSKIYEKKYDIRAVIRLSGTEPKIRIMAEGKQLDVVEKAMAEMIEYIEKFE